MTDTGIAIGLVRVLIVSFQFFFYSQSGKPIKMKVMWHLVRFVPHRFLAYGNVTEPQSFIVMLFRHIFCLYLIIAASCHLDIPIAQQTDIICCCGLLVWRVDKLSWRNNFYNDMTESHTVRYKQQISWPFLISPCGSALNPYGTNWWRCGKQRHRGKKTCQQRAGTSLTMSRSVSGARRETLWEIKKNTRDRLTQGSSTDRASVGSNSRL